VVCPALPGYGFSGKPKQNGWSVEKIGRAGIIRSSSANSGRVQHYSERDLSRVAPLGREALNESGVLEPVGERRALRGLGAA